MSELETRVNNYINNELLNNYLSYSRKWAKENQDFLVDTTDFIKGIEQAKQKVLGDINDKKNNRGKLRKV